jgi:hypothetical protein
MGDGLLYQRAPACLQAVVGPLGVAEPADGAAIPDRGMPMLVCLGQPAEPRSSRLATSTSSSTRPVRPVQGVRARGSCPASRRPPPTTGRPRWWRPPGPGGVEVAFGVVQHLLVGPAAGRCARVASPSTQTASPAAASSQASGAGSSRVVMKVPSGWQNPPRQARQAASPGCRHLGRGDADQTAGAPVRQPIQQHRGDRVQADSSDSGRCRRYRADGMAPGGPGELPARPARLQAAMHVGRMTTRTRPPWQASTPCRWSGPGQRLGAPISTATAVRQWIGQAMPAPAWSSGAVTGRYWKRETKRRCQGVSTAPGG